MCRNIIHFQPNVQTLQSALIFIGPNRSAARAKNFRYLELETDPDMGAIRWGARGKRPPTFSDSGE